jgi:hypothetical protein
MYYELTKSQKKIARRVMDKGLEAHYQRALADIETILDSWREGKFESTRDAYMEMYQRVKMHDKNIGGIYDDKSGSRWVEVMALQYADGTITMDDLKELGEEVCGVIRFLNGEK